MLTVMSGFCLAFLITSAFFVGNTIAFWVIIYACLLCVAGATYLWYDKVVIPASSFIGAYSMVRALSIYIGKFPEETSLHLKLLNGDVKWSTYPKVFYVYIVFIIILTPLLHKIQTKKEKQLELQAKTSI